MMRLISFILLSTLLASGCVRVQKQGPQIPAPNATQKIAKAKASLKEKQKSFSPSNPPEILGGIIQSDSWIIYKDKQQEEFKGNVSYDNGMYVFKSDYALSDRAKQQFSASGNVFLKQNDSNGSFYEVYTDYALYRYKAQKVRLKAAEGKRIKLVYSDEKQQKITAFSKTSSVDLATKVFILEGDVLVERPTEQGMEKFTAQKAIFDQIKMFGKLEGNAVLSDEQRTLQADKVVYDRSQNRSYAEGSRPLLTGKMEQGDFAIIADKVESDNEAKKIIMNGKVQGWLVSPKLNDSPINAKF